MPILAPPRTLRCSTIQALTTNGSGPLAGFQGSRARVLQINCRMMETAREMRFQEVQNIKQCEFTQRGHKSESSEW